MKKLKDPMVYVPLLIILGIVAILGISSLASKNGMIGYGQNEHGHEH